jgi:hypothetical protein
MDRIPDREVAVTDDDQIPLKQVLWTMECSEALGDSVRHGERLIRRTTKAEQSEAASSLLQRTPPRQRRFPTGAEAGIWGAHCWGRRVRSWSSKLALRQRSASVTDAATAGSDNQSAYRQKASAEPFEYHMHRFLSLKGTWFTARSATARGILLAFPPSSV